MLFYKFYFWIDAVLCPVLCIATLGRTSRHARDMGRITTAAADALCYGEAFGRVLRYVPLVGLVSLFLLLICASHFIRAPISGVLWVPCILQAGYGLLIGGVFEMVAVVVIILIIVTGRVAEVWSCGCVSPLPQLLGTDCQPRGVWGELAGSAASGRGKSRRRGGMLVWETGNQMTMLTDR
uniref:Uncharacterized protein TCIL3000_11_2900 n=1 Tax=Trypanosoma congolense (strain IL3000) TaxID=1068625 RepID=G0UZS7_TRYCI|nr:unnamed protein product [Trypanosoma congolense IL3000]